MKLTEPQRKLLAYLAAEQGRAACERVCHPNTAAALERRGLLTIEDGDGSFRPWFDCAITDAGRTALCVPQPNKEPNVTEKARHTPGPWTIIPARPYDGDEPDLVGSFESFAGIEGSDGSPVCVFGDAAGSATMFENEADYHLIAAGPELLAVAKLALRVDDEWKALSMDERTRVEAAIAKAEALPTPAEGDA